MELVEKKLDKTNLEESFIFNCLKDYISPVQTINLKNLKLIDGILRSNSSLLKLESLNKYNENLEEIYLQSFAQVIPMEKSKSIFNTAYPITFEENLKDRYPTALLTYGSALKNLPEHLGLFAEYIYQVLSDTFTHERYEQSIHLNKIFEKDPSLKDKWKQNQRKILLSDGNLTSIEFDGFKFLKEKIQGKHLDLKEYSHLKAFLKKPLEIEKFLNELSLAPKGSKRSLERECIRLATRQTEIERLKTAKNILKLLKEHDPEVEFKNDIEGLLAKTNKQGGKYSIVSTDDPYDLLLCGTEVAGSCQRIDGSSDLNQCLLNYLLDGKNKLLAVKDLKENKILARAILRVLIDEGNDQPVLFLEQIYSNNTEFTNELINMAISEGERLGLPVLTKDRGENNPPYSNQIESLSSKAPTEYVDALECVTNEKFTLKNLFLLKPV